MKKLLTLTTLLCSLMFSSASFGEWTKVVKGDNGDDFYVDMERIRNHNGFRYYWVLTDKLEPSEYGTLSNKSYEQADCKQFRKKGLSVTYYHQSMGQDVDTTYTPKKSEWRFPRPDSVAEVVLKKVCEQ